MSPSGHSLIFNSAGHTRFRGTPPRRSRLQDFLALWKDADPDIPILTQRKRSSRS